MKQIMVGFVFCISYLNITAMEQDNDDQIDKIYVESKQSFLNAHPETEIRPQIRKLFEGELEKLSKIIQKIEAGPGEFLDTGYEDAPDEAPTDTKSNNKLSLSEGLEFLSFYNEPPDSTVRSFFVTKNKLVYCTFFKDLKVWDLKSKKHTDLIGHKRCVIDIKRLSDEKIVSVSWDKSIRIWNWKNSKCIKAFENLNLDKVYTIEVLSSDKLVSGHWDGSIKIWDLIRGKCLCILVNFKEIGTLKLPEKGQKLLNNKLLSYSIKIISCHFYYEEYCKIVQELIDKGADVNCRNEHSNTPLMCAIINHNLPLVELLIKNNANVDNICEDHSTPIFAAVLVKNKKILLTLVKKSNKSINIKNEDGNTPLALAVSERCVDLVEILLRYGANVNVKDQNGDSLLSLAVCYGAVEKRKFEIKDLKTLRLILEKNVSFLKSEGPRGWSALMCAAFIEDIEIFDLLLNYGADINTKNDHGTVLDFALKHRPDNKELIEHIKLKMEIDKKESSELIGLAPTELWTYELTPKQKRDFMLAIADGDEIEVMRIIESGANLDFFYFGQTPLSIIFMEQLIYDGNKKKTVVKNKNIFDAVYQKTNDIISKRDTQKLVKSEVLEDPDDFVMV